MTQTSAPVCLEDHLHTARRIAVRVWTSCGRGVTVDDCIAEGWCGLVQAWHSFSPQTGVPFGAYAQHRIRGAVLNFIANEIRSRAPRELPNDPNQRAWHGPTDVVAGRLHQLRHAVVGSQSLPTKQRRLLIARANGDSLAISAKRLGISIRSARRHTREAVYRLREGFAV